MTWGFRRWGVIVLAFLGLMFYLCSGSLFFNWPFLTWPSWAARGRDAAIVAAAALVCWPGAVHRRLGAVLDRVRDPSPRARRVATLAVWAIASLYCWGTAVRQPRDLELRTQDEMMYLVQTQHVAHGRLWLPAHPMADFFQTFYIFVKPVYAAMHFPGTAVAYAPTAWLHVPPWVLSLLIAGAVVAMTFRVVTELADTVAGVLAAALLLGLTHFRSLSVMVLPYLPMALLVLLLLWAYLHWRQEERLGWAAAMGVLAGFAAIVRPLDTVCFGVPIALAMCLDLRGAGWRRLVGTVAVVAACAAPLVSLQLLADRGITGHWLEAPVQQYHKTFWPGVEMGLHPRLLRGKFLPSTDLPQFKDNYDDFVVPQIAKNNETLGVGHRVVQTIGWGLPNAMLVILLPVGLLGLRDRRRLAWFGGLALFPVAYLSFLYTQHYVAILAPGLLFLVVLGAREVVRAFGARGRGFAGAWLPLALAGLALVSLPEVGRVRDRTTRSPVMQAFNRAAKTLERPAVVFFRYDRKTDGLWKHEQTYNFETAWIDDASVVRAQDRGERNVDLINYYAKVQPERTIYVFDQRACEVTRLGKARELARP